MQAVSDTCVTRVYYGPLVTTERNEASIAKKTRALRVALSFFSSFFVVVSVAPSIVQSIRDHLLRPTVPYMRLISPWLAWPTLLLSRHGVHAQSGGTFVQAGNTLVSAMMVCSSTSVYMFDLTELCRCSWAMKRKSTFWIRLRVMLPRLMATQPGAQCGASFYQRYAATWVELCVQGHQFPPSYRHGRGHEFILRFRDASSQWFLCDLWRQ